MATVIQEQQSRGDLRRNAIGNALGGIIEKGAEGYQNRADEMALQKAIGGLPKDASPQDVLNTITGVHTYRPEAKQNMFKNYLGAKEFEATQLKTKAIQDEKKAKEDAEKADAITLLDNSLLEEEQKNELKKQVVEGKAGLRAVEGILKAQKENRKIKDEEKSFETTQKSYDKLVNLIEKVGVSGAITSQFGGEDAEAYAEFTSLTGAIESLLVEKVNRGTLSNTRFNYITKDLLPKPNDSQATIRGKLRGLATILNLDSSKLTGENNTESPTKQSEKRPSLSSFERK